MKNDTFKNAQHVNKLARNIAKCAERVNKAAREVELIVSKRPLSELPNNEEDCRKIYKFVTGYSMTRIKSNYDFGIFLEGDPNKTSLYIKYNGQTYGCEGWKRSNIFDIVDFIRSLGYEPT